MTSTPIIFESATVLAVGVALALLAVTVAVWRRPALPVLSQVLATIGLVLLALAAGGPAWHRPATGDVVVMVDLSPSTRTAQFRKPARWAERVGQLLRDTPYRIVYFAGAEPLTAPAEGSTREPLPDARVDRTLFRPPAAAAILLFSDVQFDLPAAAPPVHVAVDPALEQPADASIEQLEERDRELVATVRNGGALRELTVSPAAESGREPRTISPGGGVVTLPLAPQPAGPVVVRLEAGDAWPENDALSLIPLPPEESQKWWVGSGEPSPGWQAYRPQNLPTEAMAYLAPSVVVLDNVAASDLTELQRQRLGQYVRDLGGGLVILGGDRAFAAGGYAGTVLNALSPLASHPPEPMAHWVILVDSSGSMSAPTAGGATRWRIAVDAAAQSLGSLPPHDRVSVAGFAAGVDWWVRARPVADASADPMPPPNARPSGPTELARAIESAAAVDEDGARLEVVLLTDANAAVDAPEALTALLTQRDARLHLLDIGDAAGSGVAVIRQMVTATGGTSLGESDPAGWAAAVRRLTRAAAPQRIVNDAARVEFTGPLAGTSPQAIAPPWNRTWIKPQASSLVVTRPGEARPLAASWAAGEGTVVAAGFAASATDAAPLVRLAARAPGDSRLRVFWDTGPRLRVSVEALDPSTDGGVPAFLNSVPLALEVNESAGAGSAASPIPQVAPGRYELEVAVPGAPVIATVRVGGRVASRFAVAGRYPPEYERIGNDRRAMRDLAARTGGSVVEPSATGVLPLPAARGPLPLASPLAAAAAVLLAAALVRWRMG